MFKLNLHLDKSLFLVLALLAGNALIIYAIQDGYSILLSVIYTALLMSCFFLLERMFLPVFAIPIFLAEFFLYFKYLPRKNDGLYYEYLFLSPDGYKPLLNDLFLSVNSMLSTGQISELMRGFFLLFLYPFIDKEIGYENYMYLPVNLLTISVITIVYIKFIDTFFRNHPSPFISHLNYNLIKSISVFLLIISPTMVLHSNELLKDFTTLLLIILSAYFYTNKNILLFLAVLLLAFLNRSYSPLIIALYILAARKPSRSDYFYISVFCVAIIALVQANISAIGNMVLSIPYIFINPLPVKFANWEFPIAMATFGGCLFAIGLFGSILMIFFRKYRRFGLNRLPISIFLFGFLLIAVGYNNIVRFEETQYVFGTAGDNNFRKVIPILPLLILQFTTSVFIFLFKQKE